MRDIPLVDLKAQYQILKKEIDQKIKKVISCSDFILGEELNLFEKEIAKYLGVKFAIGVASGTDALVLSLVGLEIKPGNEVITTPFSFAATSEAICRLGAKPVFVDIDYKTLNIDTKKVREKITKNTKVIILVHLYGMPCQMDEFLKIAQEYKLKIVEDCAQAFGSEYKNKKVGSFGDYGCFSFFPAKNLGAFGDGGLVVTNDEDLAQRIKLLRNHGRESKYFHKIIGFNSRLDTLQAAILRVKLKHIDKWIKQRINNAFYYNSLLKENPQLVLPEVPSEYKHSFNYYTIRIKNKKRSLVQEMLTKNNISSAVYYPLSLHLQPMHKDLGYKLGDFPQAELAQEEVLSLPMYPEITYNQIKKISTIIKKALS